MCTKDFRQRLFEEQDGKCIWCGEQMSLTNRKKNGQPAMDFATYEHMTPKMYGGTNAHNNIALSHKKCNYARNRYDQEHDKIIKELEINSPIEE